MKRKDINQAAFSIVQQATGEAQRPAVNPKKKAAQDSGRRGGGIFSPMDNPLKINGLDSFSCKSAPMGVSAIALIFMSLTRADPLVLFMPSAVAIPRWLMTAVFFASLST